MVILQMSLLAALMMVVYRISTFAKVIRSVSSSGEICVRYIYSGADYSLLSTLEGDTGNYIDRLQLGQALDISGDINSDNFGDSIAGAGACRLVWVVCLPNVIITMSNVIAAG